MKNLQFIKGVDESVLDSISRTDSQYRRMIRVSCDVLDFDEENRVITVRVAQTAKPTDKVYTAKELIEKANEVFSHLPQDVFKLRFRPLLFAGEGLEAVGPKWVKSNLKKWDMTQRELADQLGVDEFALSKILAEEYEFTRWHKAAFWYFFKALKGS